MASFSVGAVGKAAKTRKIPKLSLQLGDENKENIIGNNAPYATIPQHAAVPKPAAVPPPTAVSVIFNQVHSHILGVPPSDNTVNRVMSLAKTAKPLTEHTALGEKMFAYKDGDSLVKIYNYDKSNSVVQKSILKEISFQIYSSNINSICEFETPKIYEYGRFPLTSTQINPEMYRYNTIIFIRMAFIPYLPLDKAVKNIDLTSEAACETLANKIRSVEECMQQNGLHHNDLHKQNVFYDAQTGKIGIIDYGEASEGPVNFDESRYNCAYLRKVKNASSASSASSSSATRGGKKKRRPHRASKKAAKKMPTRKVRRRRRL
jgi:predicted Ser/Thr protein kinase